MAQPTPPRSATPPATSRPTLAPGAEDRTQRRSEMLEIRVFDETRVRTIFALIDADADDRLSIFEVARAFDETTAARDPSLFRRLDTNQDGFLDWPEFERRVRSSLDVTGHFRFYPARPIPKDMREPRDRSTAPEDPTTTKAVAEFLATNDADGDGDVSREEFMAMLSAASLPADNWQHFVQADRDKNLRLDRAELAALVRNWPAALIGSRTTLPGSGAFPKDWQMVDRNRDGEISVTEMESALRRIEPFLGRWAAQVIAGADRTRDNRLGPAEIIGARKSTTERR